MYAVSKISTSPHKEKQSDECQHLQNLIFANDKQTEDRINHCHTKHNICLISQFEHGIGSGISVFINIADIYKFRNQDESNRAKSQKYCKKIRQSDRRKQMVKRFLLCPTQFLYKQRNYKQNRQDPRQSPEHQKLMWQRMMLCRRNSLYHIAGIKL